MQTELVVDERYVGIPGVTVGGYIAGLAAKSLGPLVAVTLTRPVRPGATVVVERDESQVLVRADGELAATAITSRFESTAPDAVAPADAEEAAKRYPGLHHHLFPYCFTCGPARSFDDGLRVFPGPIDGRSLVATLWRPPPSVWQPDGNVAPEFLWAALDCPAIWAHIIYGHSDPDDRAVTGRLAMQLHAPVRGNSASIVLGWPIERQGRQIIAGAGIFSEGGDLLVEARQTMWLTGRGVPLALSAW